MRKTVLTLSLSFLCYSLFGQQDSLLRNFKYRISHYRAITINIGGGGQLSKTGFTSNPDKYSYGAGNLGSTYSFIKSTERVLLEAFGAASFSFNFGKNENDITENRNRSTYSSAQFGVLNKWFSKKSFFELGGEITSNLSVSKTNQTPSPVSYKSNDFNQGLSLNIGIGKGRLEKVTDMQNALWLVRLLADENKFSRPLSANELNELGRTITTANNTRILDHRRRTQFILETVDDYFQKMGLIGITDIRYFSSLNDILFFANNNNRKSGTEKFIRLYPSINYYNRDLLDNVISTKSEFRANTKSASLSTGINRYRPVNLKHQNNMGASLKASYLSHHFTDKLFTAGSITSSSGIDQTIKQAAVNLFFQHAIYPNTRTIISVNFDAESGYQDVNGNSDYFGMTTFSGSFNYFISYRTRFNCNLGASWLKNVYDYGIYQTIYPDNIHVFMNAGLFINL